MGLFKDCHFIGYLLWPAYLDRKMTGVIGNHIHCYFSRFSLGCSGIYGLLGFSSGFVEERAHTPHYIPCIDYGYVKSGKIDIPVFIVGRDDKEQVIVPAYC